MHVVSDILAGNCHVICFGILLITEELKPFSVIILPPSMAMLHCRAGDVRKPAYKNQAYMDTLKVGFTSKHEALLRREFL